MNPGENFLLVVYDASANRTITYTQEFDQWSNQNGAVIPAYSDCRRYMSLIAVQTIAGTVAFLQ
jgi:hypothetical protein